MNSTFFLIAAYLAIWAGIFGYLLVTGRHQQRLARRLEMLEERISRTEAGQ
ncbi:MAG TPA: CcmD family protein [Desulfobulbus sp.]|nr:CcmD family protein [Desulfobulbus sp.]